MATCFYQNAFRNVEYNLRKGLANMSLHNRIVSNCEFEAFKTLYCYTIHYQNYKIKCFSQPGNNIEKAPLDLIILQSKGLNLADTFYCVVLRAPRN